MPEIEQLTINLPAPVARLIREKVESGEYANESEVIADGILQLNGSGVEITDNWLRKEAVPSLQSIDADPSRGLTADQVLAHLHERHHQLRKAG